MATIHLLPGDFVCDALTVPPAAKVKAAGYKAAAFYTKNFSKAQLAEYGAAGVAVWMISEFQAGRPLLGAAQGAADGRLERRRVDALGYHGTLIVAVDYNVGPANVAVTLEYLRAFKQAYGGPCGVYGDWDVAAALTPGEFVPLWKPAAEAWSWQWVVNKFVRRTHPLTDIWQKVGGALIPGVDHGVVLRAVDAWLPDYAAPLPKKVTIPEVDLSVGSVGPQVRLLQQICNDNGWCGLFKLKLDGVFGPKTRAAVVRMQKRLGRTPDGVYGPRTRGSLREFLSR